jgi:ankyrin repeat protein
LLQLKEPPNPATIAQNLFEEFRKPTKDWDQVRQWVQEYPDVCKEKNIDGSLPLHRACSEKAPLNVIELLVETWPNAVKEKDCNGCLPLHIACNNNAPLDVIQLLVETWPDAVKEKDCDGDLPLQHICYNDLLVTAPLYGIKLLVET